MQYAIELFFNQEMEEKINFLVTMIADKSISTKYLEWKTRPHLTLACFNDVDEEKCINCLKAFAQNHHKLLAGLGSVGMFVDTKGYEWYVPNRWIPHCTIALTGEDKEDSFYRASDLVLHEFEQLVGEFTSIGLVKISYPVEEIYTIDLN